MSFVFFIFSSNIDGLDLTFSSKMMYDMNLQNNLEDLDILDYCHNGIVLKYVSQCF